MESLSEVLVVPGAAVEDWTFRNTEKGLKAHFSVRGKLTQQLAAALGCKFVYASDVDALSLGHELKDTEILLPIAGGEESEKPETASFFPDVVYKFKVAKQDDGFSVQCLVHISVRIDELHEILKGYSGDGGLEIQLRPRQGNLFDGGTRVEMGGSDGQEPVSDHLAGEALEQHGAIASKAQMKRSRVQ
jgi:hypothetical protein